MMKMGLVQLSFMLGCLGAAWASLEVEEDQLADDFAIATTIGQLCKTVDFVGICSLLNVDTNTEFRTVLTWKVEKSVAGKLATTNTTISVQTDMRPPGYPKKDERCLVFAAKTLFPIVQGTTGNVAVFRWDFTREGTCVKKSEWQLVGDERGVIPLREQEEDVVLQTVTAYWGHLRDPSRLIEEYYAFLKEQRKSKVKRIRCDARLDLLLLIRFADADTLKRMTKDEDLDEELKAYAGKILKYRESIGGQRGRPLTIRFTSSE